MLLQKVMLMVLFKVLMLKDHALLLLLAPILRLVAHKQLTVLLLLLVIECWLRIKRLKQLMVFTLLLLVLGPAQQIWITGLKCQPHLALLNKELLMLILAGFALLILAERLEQLLLLGSSFLLLGK